MMKLILTLERSAPRQANEQDGLNVETLNSVDSAIIGLLAEQSRSLRAAYSSSAETSNRMIQFLAVASAAFGTLAVNTALRGDQAGMWTASLLLLVGLPGTIALIYLAWVREFLQKARASLLLLRLEGRISRLVTRLQKSFQQDSNESRRKMYAALAEVFADRYLDSEIWMRRENPLRKNLIERRAYIAISLTFFVVAILSLDVGFLIGNAQLRAQCHGEIDNSPLQQLSAVVRNAGLGGWVLPISLSMETRAICEEKPENNFLGYLIIAYILVLGSGLAVGAYTIGLLRVVSRIEKELVRTLY